ncbi:MAG: glycosyl transferase family 1, partial [Acidobacteria bacterium]|nr:glycosyl transferase family 1 [Acidobacteriota bacterium]NIQ83999.1 glycosyl transferase family 1 [Acidobacteriota bacterium]
MARLDLDRTRRFEARVPPSFDRILATSTVDAAHLMSLMGDNAGVAPTMLSAVDVVPNGVDLDYFT